MAKKKNKKRDRYTTGGRVDYRQGGRVSLQEGGNPMIDPETGRAIPKMPMTEDIQRIGQEAASKALGNNFQQAYYGGREPGIGGEDFGRGRGGCWRGY